MRWVDDSISTEPEAAKFAIESFPDAEIVLDRRRLRPRAGLRGARRRRSPRAARACSALPDTGARLVDAARAAGVPADRATVVADLPAAVAAARAVARPGTVVLLSPAAPSFNTHKNFAARGDHFARVWPVMRPDDRAGLRVYRFESVPPDRVDALVTTRRDGLDLSLKREASTMRRGSSRPTTCRTSAAWCIQVHSDVVAYVDAPQARRAAPTR